MRPGACADKDWDCNTLRGIHLIESIIETGGKAQCLKTLNIWFRAK
jgi:hypothetical protein